MFFVPHRSKNAHLMDEGHEDKVVLHVAYHEELYEQIRGQRNNRINTQRVFRTDGRFETNSYYIYWTFYQNARFERVSKDTENPRRQAIVKNYASIGFREDALSIVSDALKNHGRLFEISSEQVEQHFRLTYPNSESFLEYVTDKLRKNISMWHRMQRVELPQTPIFNAPYMKDCFYRDYVKNMQSYRGFGAPNATALAEALFIEATEYLYGKNAVRIDADDFIKYANDCLCDKLHLWHQVIAILHPLALVELHKWYVLAETSKLGPTVGRTEYAVEYIVDSLLFLLKKSYSRTVADKCFTDQHLLSHLLRMKPDRVIYAYKKGHVLFKRADRAGSFRHLLGILGGSGGAYYGSDGEAITKLKHVNVKFLSVIYASVAIKELKWPKLYYETAPLRKFLANGENSDILLRNILQHDFEKAKRKLENFKTDENSDWCYNPRVDLYYTNKVVPLIKTIQNSHLLEKMFECKQSEITALVREEKKIIDYQLLKEICRSVFADDDFLVKAIPKKLSNGHYQSEAYKEDGKNNVAVWILQHYPSAARKYSPTQLANRQKIGLRFVTAVMYQDLRSSTAVEQDIIAYMRREKSKYDNTSDNHSNDSTKSDDPREYMRELETVIDNDIKRVELICTADDENQLSFDYIHKSQEKDVVFAADDMKSSIWQSSSDVREIYLKKANESSEMVVAQNALSEAILSLCLTNRKIVEGVLERETRKSFGDLKSCIDEHEYACKHGVSQIELDNRRRDILNAASRPKVLKTFVKHNTFLDTWSSEYLPEITENSQTIFHFLGPLIGVQYHLYKLGKVNEGIQEINLICTTDVNQKKKNSYHNVHILLHEEEVESQDGESKETKSKEEAESKDDVASKEDDESKDEVTSKEYDVSDGDDNLKKDEAKTTKKIVKRKLINLRPKGQPIRKQFFVMNAQKFTIPIPTDGDNLTDEKTVLEVKNIKIKDRDDDEEDDEEENAEEGKSVIQSEQLFHYLKLLNHSIDLLIDQNEKKKGHIKDPKTGKRMRLETDDEFEQRVKDERVVYIQNERNVKETLKVLSSMINDQPMLVQSVDGEPNMDVQLILATLKFAKEAEQVSERIRERKIALFRDVVDKIDRPEKDFIYYVSDIKTDRKSGDVTALVRAKFKNKDLARLVRTVNQELDQNDENVEEKEFARIDGIMMKAYLSASGEFRLHREGNDIRTVKFRRLFPHQVLFLEECIKCLCSEDGSWGLHMFHGTGTGKSFTMSVLASMNKDTTVLSGVGDVAAQALLRNVSHVQRVQAALLDNNTDLKLKKCESSFKQLFKFKLDYVKARRQLWKDVEQIKNNKVNVEAFVNGKLTKWVSKFQIDCLVVACEKREQNSVLDYDRFVENCVPFKVKDDHLHKMHKTLDVYRSAAVKVASKLEESLESSLEKEFGNMEVLEFNPRDWDWNKMFETIEVANTLCKNVFKNKLSKKVIKDIKKLQIDFTSRVKSYFKNQFGKSIVEFTTACQQFGRNFGGKELRAFDHREVLGEQPEYKSIVEELERSADGEVSVSQLLLSYQAKKTFILRQKDGEKRDEFLKDLGFEGDTAYAPDMFVVPVMTLTYMLSQNKENGRVSESDQTITHVIDEIHLIESLTREIKDDLLDIVKRNKLFTIGASANRSTYIKENLFKGNEVHQISLQYMKEQHLMCDVHCHRNVASLKDEKTGHNQVLDVDEGGLLFLEMTKEPTNICAEVLSQLAETPSLSERVESTMFKSIRMVYTDDESELVMNALVEANVFYTIGNDEDAAYLDETTFHEHKLIELSEDVSKELFEKLRDAKIIDRNGEIDPYFNHFDAANVINRLQSEEVQISNSKSESIITHLIELSSKSQKKYAFCSGEDSDTRISEDALKAIHTNEKLRKNILDYLDRGLIITNWEYPMQFFRQLCHSLIHLHRQQSPDNYFLNNVGIIYKSCRTDGEFNNLGLLAKGLNGTRTAMYDGPRGALVQRCARYVVLALLLNRQSVKEIDVNMVSGQTQMEVESLSMEEAKVRMNKTKTEIDTTLMNGIFSVHRHSEDDEQTNDYSVALADYCTYIYDMCQNVYQACKQMQAERKQKGDQFKGNVGDFDWIFFVISNQATVHSHHKLMGTLRQHFFARSYLTRNTSGENKNVAQKLVTDLSTGLVHIAVCDNALSGSIDVPSARWIISYLSSFELGRSGFSTMTTRIQMIGRLTRRGDGRALFYTRTMGDLSSINAEWSHVNTMLEGVSFPANLNDALNRSKNSVELNSAFIVDPENSAAHYNISEKDFDMVNASLKDFLSGAEFSDDKLGDVDQLKNVLANQNQSEILGGHVERHLNIKIRMLLTRISYVLYDYIRFKIIDNGKLRAKLDGEENQEEKAKLGDYINTAEAFKTKATNVLASLNALIEACRNGLIALDPNHENEEHGKIGYILAKCALRVTLSNIEKETSRYLDVFLTAQHTGDSDKRPEAMVGIEKLLSGNFFFFNFLYGEGTEFGQIYINCIRQCKYYVIFNVLNRYNKGLLVFDEETLTTRRKENKETGTVTDSNKFIFESDDKAAKESKYSIMEKKEALQEFLGRCVHIKQLAKYFIPRLNKRKHAEKNVEKFVSRLRGNMSGTGKTGRTIIDFIVANLNMFERYVYPRVERGENFYLLVLDLVVERERNLAQKDGIVFDVSAGLSHPLDTVWISDRYVHKFLGVIDFLRGKGNAGTTTQVLKLITFLATKHKDTRFCGQMDEIYWYERRDETKKTKGMTSTLDDSDDEDAEEGESKVDESIRCFSKLVQTLVNCPASVMRDGFQFVYDAKIVPFYANRLSLFIAANMQQVLNSRENEYEMDDKEKKERDQRKKQLIEIFLHLGTLEGENASPEGCVCKQVEDVVRRTDVFNVAMFNEQHAIMVGAYLDNTDTELDGCGRLKWISSEFTQICCINNVMDTSCLGTIGKLSLMLLQDVANIIQLTPAACTLTIDALIPPVVEWLLDEDDEEHEQDRYDCREAIKRIGLADSDTKLFKRCKLLQQFFNRAASKLNSVPDEKNYVKSSLHSLSQISSRVEALKEHKWNLISSQDNKHIPQLWNEAGVKNFYLLKSSVFNAGNKLLEGFADRVLEKMLERYHENKTHGKFKQAANSLFSAEQYAQFYSDKLASEFENDEPECDLHTWATKVLASQQIPSKFIEAMKSGRKSPSRKSP